MIGRLAKDPAARTNESFDVAPFEKAVVIAVYLGEHTLGEIISAAAELNINLDERRLPLNSAIVRRTSRGLDGAVTAGALCYPFFSSHLMFPIKVAETVWVIFDRDRKNVGFWLSRVHGDGYAEDVNYSHFDRSYGLSTDGQISTINDFPNVSLRPNSRFNEYDRILSGSYSYLANQMLEPVPRFSRRMGDFGLQGSNNSLIILGTDRGWGNDEIIQGTGTNAAEIPIPFSGMVDVVVGRSRGLSGAQSSQTDPSTYVNARGFNEIVKDPERRGLNSIRNEGDPDFMNDAARLYVAMRCLFDERLGLIASTATLFGGQKLDDNSGAVVINKADHLRLVAREGGSIRIVKEGSLDASASSIVMLAAGTLQASGRVIYFGRDAADGGAGDGPADAPGATQPWIK